MQLIDSWLAGRVWRWWSGVVEAEGSASHQGTVTVGMSAWRGAGGLATLTGVLVVARGCSRAGTASSRPMR
jgi:hypothetical protein